MLVFHVSLLKALAPTTQPQPLSYILSENLELQVFPAEVKVIHNITQGSVVVLIQLQDLPDFKATSESIDVIKEQFPSFHLKDKMTFWGESIVRPLIRNVYSRKGHK